MIFGNLINLKINLNLSVARMDNSERGSFKGGISRISSI